MKTLNCKITFSEPLLGTSPADPDIYKNFVGDKAPDPETLEAEVEALTAGKDEADEEEAEEEPSITVFHRLEDGTPFLYDYQIKGFFKDSCGGLRKVTGSESAKIKAYKKEIDKLIFPEPRKIPIHFDGDITICQRPLRASGPKGERTAIAVSEEIPAGATIEFAVVMLADSHEKAVREWLDYGRFSGIGQWRNSGKGRFTWEEVPE